MKNYIAYLFPLLLLFLFTSCQKTGEENMSSQNRDVVYKAMKAFEAGDLNMLDSLASDDFIEHQIDTAHMKARGLDAVKEMSNAMHKAIPDMKFDINAIAVTGDTAMVYNTVKGTMKDSLMGMPPTNSAVSWAGVDVFIVKDGKISEHWGFADMTTMPQMMMPPPKMTEKKMKKH